MSTGKTREQLRVEIEELKKKLTGDMFKDMDTKNAIHTLEMQINQTKPTDSHFNCEGCGS